MAKSKAQKKTILKELTEKIGSAKSIFFAIFKQVSVKESEALRRELKASESEYYVAKKTILDLALKEKRAAWPAAEMPAGQVAVIMNYADEIAPAKIIDRFSAENEGKLEVFGAWLEGQYTGGAVVGELAKIPSRPELYGLLVGTLAAPVRGLVGVFAGSLRRLPAVLKAVGDKKAG